MRGARLFGVVVAAAAGLCVALAAPAAQAQEQGAPPGFGFSDPPVKEKPAGQAAGEAAADEEAAPAGDAGGAAPAQKAAGKGAPEKPPWGDGRIARGPEKVPIPAGGQPYQWGFMAFAAGLMLLMVLFVIWLVRRSSRRP